MKIMIKQSLALVMALFLVAAGGARAAEQVTFGRKLAAGDKFTFTQTMVMDNNINVNAGGQQQQVQQKMTQNRSGTTAIEAVDANGKPTKMTFAFDRTTGGEMAMNGQSQAVPSALAGQTVTVTRTGEKELNYSAQLDEAAAKEVKEMFDMEHNLLPSKPISVGDSWDVDPKELGSMMPPGGQMEAKAKGKLVSVETVNGRQVAKVEFNIDMNGGANGMVMKIQLAGKGTMDVASGQPIDLEISGPIKGSGRQPIPGGGAADFAMEGKMTMTVKNKREGGGGGNPGANAGEVINPIGGNPVAAGADFSGTFSNEKLSIKLVSGFAGWTGTIKTGDKEYPISSATVNGSKISGKFTAGGNSFDFDGALEGKTLTLSTGGATYNLTKAAAANPLGQ